MPVPVSRQPLHLLELDLRWPPETFLRWKLEGLAARGLRVTVASRWISDPTAELAGVELVALPQQGTVTNGRTTAAVRRTVARLRPDVVHIEWNHSAARYLPLYERWRCAIVTSCHGSQLSADPHLPGHEAFARRLPAVFRAASAVHCVSASLRRAVLALGVEESKARVIRQGVDTSVFRPIDRGEPQRRERLRVISIGWPRWVKGFEWALQAIRELVDAGVPATLEILGTDAGEATERMRLQHTVDDLGLSGCARLSGSLATDEVAERLRACDVLLVPSLDEGLPTVVLEAMASGLPIVATDCGGLSEAVRDGVEGFLVAPRDARAMAGSLAQLWHEPELALRMGAAGRRTVTAEFTLKRQLDEFLALYEELAAA
jgi:colanic acid/amylovoran biosynthesis glycosyltransferase